MTKISNQDFRNKKKIINTFNSSQEYYQKYLTLKDSDIEKAQEALDISGSRLYCVFEWIMKHHLYNEYSIKFGLSHNEVRKRKEGLLKGKFWNKGQKVNVNTDFLCMEMSLYANPNPSSTKINFKLVKDNRWGVNNGQKHIGLPVNQRKCQDSLAEIKKMILIYIDSNAPIQVQESPEYTKLQEDHNYWSENSKYDFGLIVEDTSMLEEKDLQLLVSIPWNIVFDFNSSSDKNGIRKAFLERKGFQSNIFNPINPMSTRFNPMSNSPYWYMANGMIDLKDSLVNNSREWRQKYGSQLINCIKKYHEVFSKPIKIVIVNGDAKKIEKIIEAFDTCYEDKMKVSLLANEAQFDSFLSDYESIVLKYPMSVREFAYGLNSYSSLLGFEKKATGKAIVGRNGRVAFKTEKCSHFEVLYKGIADDVSEESMDKDEEAFYQGKSQLSWYGVKNEFAVQRNSQFREICDQINQRCKDIPYSILKFQHEPGSGGTTLIRQVAYHISMTHPVVVMKYYEERLSCLQIGYLYDKVHTSLVIVIESTTLNEDYVQKFEEELNASSIPHVIVYVSRKSQYQKNVIRF